MQAAIILVVKKKVIIVPIDKIVLQGWIKNGESDKPYYKGS